MNPWQQPQAPAKAPTIPNQAVPGAPTPQQVFNQGGSYTAGYDNKGPTDPIQSQAATYYIPPYGAALGALNGLGGRSGMGGFGGGAQPAVSVGFTPPAAAQPQAQQPQAAPPTLPSPYTPPSQNPLPAAPVSQVQRPNLPAQVNVGAGGPSSQQLAANNDSIYARAKDEAGSTARAALTGLQGELQARGMGGAGYEAGQIGGTLSREADTIGQVSRQNAQTQYDQALARAQQADSLNVTQRGQDIGALDSLYGIDVGAAVSQRGQDIGASTSKYGTDVGASIAARGQDLGRYNTDVNADLSRGNQGLTARGQDISAAEAAGQQGLSKYGIDVNSANQAAQRAQQQQMALLGLTRSLY